MVTEAKQRLFKKESLVILLAFLAVLGLTFVMIIITRNENEGREETNDIPLLTQEEYEKATTFDPEEISNYSTVSDCWVIYKEGVYDVSKILNTIPEIKANNCGSEYGNELSASSQQKIAPYLVAYTN